VRDGGGDGGHALGGPATTKAPTLALSKLQVAKRRRLPKEARATRWQLAPRRPQLRDHGRWNNACVDAGVGPDRFESMLSCLEHWQPWSNDNIAVSAAERAWTVMYMTIQMSTALRPAQAVHRHQRRRDTLTVLCDCVCLSLRNKNIRKGWPTVLATVDAVDCRLPS